MKVKITKEQQELLNTGTIVSTPENVTYHYLPFWYKKKRKMKMCLKLFR